MKEKIYLIFNEIHKELPCNVGFFYKEEDAITYVEKANKGIECHENKYCYYEEIELMKGDE